VGGVLVEVGCWWIVCVGVWMAMLSAWSPHDLVVAVGAALPCALAAAGARRAVEGVWRPPIAAWRWLLVLPLTIVTDSVKILSLPWRRSADAGVLRTVRLGPTGDDARSLGHRALAVAVLSTSPSTFVVGVDDDAGTALLHAVGSPGRVERAVDEAAAR
jgi:multisubunit Na+/H+ antiporter MnhE subunit